MCERMAYGAYGINRPATRLNGLSRKHLGGLATYGTEKGSIPYVLCPHDLLAQQQVTGVWIVWLYKGIDPYAASRHGSPQGFRFPAGRDGRTGGRPRAGNLLSGAFLGLRIKRTYREQRLHTQ